MGKEILSEKQLKFLELVSRSRDVTDHFYLTGGTALAAFYLNHRESEDLDFFSEKEMEPLAIEAFLKKNQKGLGFKTFEFQRSFNRNLYFLAFRGAVLKTEFTFFPFSPLEQGKREGLLRIDSLRDIAVNKAFTISQQPRARDFIDLLFILQKTKWQLLDLIRDARAKFDAHIDLVQLGANLLKVRDRKDMPKMIVRLDAKKLERFFVEEARRLRTALLR